MTILSPYESMVSGFGQIPANANAKLLIRHSFRPSLKWEEDPDNVGLTDRGVFEAYRLGESLPMEIGFCASSPVRRCIETTRAMTKARSKTFCTSYILGYSFVEDAEMAQLKFSQAGLKEIVFQMGASKVDGFREAKKGVGALLDYVFSHGGNKGMLDLYCTHDMQIALIDHLLFNSYKDIDGLKENWPGMLEGMWLWGVRKDFHMCWRNQVRHCVNYLID